MTNQYKSYRSRVRVRGDKSKKKTTKNIIKNETKGKLIKKQKKKLLIDCKG